MASVMRMLRTDETSIEARMSQITQLYHRKPRSSESAVSMQLRAERLVDLCRRPDRLQEMAPEFQKICSTKELHNLVAKFVGGPGCIPGRPSSRGSRNDFTPTPNCSVKPKRGLADAQFKPV